MVKSIHQIMNKIDNDQRQLQKQEEEQIGLTVIGDIVFDKIVFAGEDANNSPESELFSGGALFVKKLLEMDPAINSKASIAGYTGPLENNQDLDKSHYNIKVQKRINTIELKEQEDEVYRINGPTTEIEPVAEEVAFAFKKNITAKEPTLSILVITDLGISSKPSLAVHEKGDSKLKSDGIGLRVLPQSIVDSAGDKVYEWKWHLDDAYKTNEKYNKSMAMPWHFIAISNPTTSLFDQSCYTDLTKDPDHNRGKKSTRSDSDLIKMSHIRRKTLAIVYADHLRIGCNLAIARRISIERTAQDFLQELHTNPLLSELGEFEHLIIRFGLLSVVHSYRIGNRRFHRLFFDPRHIYDSMYSTKLSGVVTGCQTVLLNNIIRQLLVLPPEERKNAYDVAERIGVGIKLGIKDCKERYDNGYGKDVEAARKFLSLSSEKLALLPKVFTDDRKEVNENLAEEEQLALDIADERIPLAYPAWSILAQSAEYKLLQAAENIVYYGVDGAVNQSKPVWAPIGRFGMKNEMIVLERYELESYRAVQLLMEEAMDAKNSSILSIAVFGPPGSGKSFVSEKIANSACRAAGYEPFIRKINLASISDGKDLTEKLDLFFNDYLEKAGNSSKSPVEPNHKDGEASDLHQDSNSHQEIPPDKRQLILFFDEFDCTVNEKSLGWLKTFLPMMQDGEFSNNHNTYDDKYKKEHNQPILIFAGGTSHTYSNFSRHDSAVDPEDQLRFAQAKGPDFVSRLKGHIDILGSDKKSDLDEGYVIRRAILLRTAFLRRLRLQHAKDEDLKRFLYGPIVRAMLTVSKYKHGARSMESIIAMFGTLPGRKIGPASIPPNAQLNMHVDANEFLKLVRSSG